MADGYALAYVNTFGRELFLLKGSNRRGDQYATQSEARGKLSNRLVRFASINEVEGFLEGNIHIQSFVRGREALVDIPYPLRLDPEFGEELSVTIYKLDDRGIPYHKPHLILRVENGQVKAYE